MQVSALSAVIGVHSSSTMQGVLFSDSIQLFNLDAMMLMGSDYCVGAEALFAFTSTKNMALVSKVSALITAAAFIVWLLLPESLPSLLTAIFFMFGLGGLSGLRIVCLYIYA